MRDLHNDNPIAPWRICRQTLSLFCFFPLFYSFTQAQDDEDAGSAKNPVEHIASYGGRMIRPVENGRYIYACQGNSLRIFDQSNPKAPKPVAWIPLNNIADAAATSGSILYISTTSYNGGWSRPNECFDISNPIHPSRVQVDDAPESLFESSDTIAPIPESFSSMQGDLEYAYRVLPDKSRLLVFAGFGNWIMFDVSDPSSPRSLGRVNLPPGENPVALMDSVILTSSTQPCLKFFNVASPATCTLKTTLTLHAPISSFAIQKKIIYLAAGTAGLIIADLSDPAKPHILTRFSTALPCQIVRAKGTRVAILAGDLFILDVTNTAHPRIASKIIVAGKMIKDMSELSHDMEAGSLEDWILSDNALILLRDEYFGGSWLQMLRPSNPRKTISAIRGSHYDCPATLRVEDNLLVSKWDAYDSRMSMSYLRFHRIHNDLRYSSLGSYEDPLTVADFALQEGIIYVADGANGLVILRLRKIGKP